MALGRLPSLPELYAVQHYSGIQLEIGQGR